MHKRCVSALHRITFEGQHCKCLSMLVIWLVWTNRSCGLFGLSVHVELRKVPFYSWGLNSGSWPWSAQCFCKYFPFRLSHLWHIHKCTPPCYVGWRHFRNKHLWETDHAIPSYVFMFSHWKPPKEWKTMKDIHSENLKEDVWAADSYRAFIIPQCQANLFVCTSAHATVLMHLHHVPLGWVAFHIVS